MSGEPADGEHAARSEGGAGGGGDGGGMAPHVSMIAIGARDLARASAFYEALGWRRSSASTPDMVFLRLRNLCLGLHPRAMLAADAGVAPEGEGFRAVAFAHNVASREAADRAFAAALRAGGRAVKAPAPTHWGGYSGYFADPDGNLWEVAHNPHVPLRADGTMDLPE